MSDQVDMPNAFDYVASAGYMKRGLMTAVSFSQQRTLGGGDIRRQDMPFVSNRMNFSKVGAMVMYPIPKLTQPGSSSSRCAHTFDGRNVGQATTFTTGLLYTVQREANSMSMPRTLVLLVRRRRDGAALPTSTGLTAAGTDAGAGNWQMIVLTGPTQIRGGAAGAGHRRSTIRRS